MLPLGLIITLGIISIFGLVINAYIFIIVIFSKQVSANNILLLHLGIVNSILCVLFLIFSLPNITRTDGNPVFESFCSLHGFLLTLLHPVALWTICCLNCDRYYAISAPLHYSALVNTKKVLVGLFAGWAVCLMLCIPPLLQFAPYQYNTELGACTPNFKLSGSLWYAILFTVTTFLFPSILIIACNLKVLLIARNHRHRIAAAIFQVTLSAQITITHQQNPFFGPFAGPKLRSRSPIPGVLQLIGSFLILYSPYYISTVWNSLLATIYNGNVPISFEAHPYILNGVAFTLTSSSFINGLLYGIKSKVMRKTFQNYWRKKRTQSEVCQEIQARTPSTCGSRRPSITGFGVLSRQLPQRRLSEIIIERKEKPAIKRVASEISWRPTSLTFADLNTIPSDINSSIPRTVSCNTLQIPISDRDYAIECSVSTPQKNSTTLLNHSNNNLNNKTISLGNTTALLQRVLRIDIKNDGQDKYNESCSLKSPRILITPAYSSENLFDEKCKQLEREHADPNNISKEELYGDRPNNSNRIQMKLNDLLQNNKYVSMSKQAYDRTSSDSECYLKLLETSSNSTTLSSDSVTRHYSSLDTQSHASNSSTLNSEQMILSTWPTTRKKYKKVQNCNKKALITSQM